MKRFLAGVDEVGRGSLAGPVVAAAVILGVNKVKGLSDSKKLSQKKRTELSNIIKLKAHAFSIATVSARIIDKVNIRNASILAMEKAIDGLKHSPRKIIVDGRDSLNSKHPVSTLVKADNLVPEVMAASIIAKVFRDELMMLLDCKYPKYSFGSHKGYATKKHIDAINSYGIIKEHRKSFGIVKNINE